jgi:glycosyltransferase involved in cell wall biosynthesis
MAKLARYLPEHGWRIQVITTEERRLPNIDRSLLAALPGATVVDRIPQPLRRPHGEQGDRVRDGLGDGTSGSARPTSRLRRLSRRLLRFCASIARATVLVPDQLMPWAIRVAVSKGHPLEPPDVVLSSGPPHSCLIAGLVLARRAGAPFVVDLRDEWTLNPYYLSRNPIRRKIERAMERACLQSAAAIVVVSDVSAQRYAAAYPELRSRVHCIPNGFDPSDIDGPRRESAPLSEAVTIAHIGSVQAHRDPGPFLRALRAVIGRRDPAARRIRLHLVGTLGPRQADQVKELLPDGVVTLDGFHTHSAALAMAAHADVLLVLSNVEEGGAVAVPGKIFEYLALRRPILAVAPDGTTTKLLRSMGAGVSADPADADAIEAAIEAVLKTAEDGRFAGPTDAQLAPYDRRRQAAAWSELLRRVADRGSDGAVAVDQRSDGQRRS